MTERLIRKRAGIPSVTRRQLREIKRIMFWPRDKRFPRCPAKNKSFVRAREAEQDFSHSDRDHICDECRCKKRAGQGTKGDFYGLGIETGHVGLGWCADHDITRSDTKILELCDDQLRKIQQVGDLQMDSLAHRKNVEEDAKLAAMSLRARQDLELVVDTLTEFKRDLNVEDREESEAVPVLRDILFRLNQMKDDDDSSDIKKEIIDAILERTCLTEMSQGRPVPMTDATKIKLKLDIAKTLSKVKLDHFKLDSSSYLHYDELKIRMPKMLTLADNLFEELKVMVMNLEENSVEQIREKWNKGCASIWCDVKTGARD